MEDRCVCCGEIIPEGQMACPHCLVTVREESSVQKRAQRVQIRLISEPDGLFPEYWPEFGKVYEAEYVPSNRRVRGQGNRAFCIVKIRGKKIVLRQGEFEIVGGAEDGN